MSKNGQTLIDRTKIVDETKNLRHALPFWYFSDKTSCYIHAFIISKTDDNLTLIEAARLFQERFGYNEDNLCVETILQKFHRQQEDLKEALMSNEERKNKAKKWYEENKNQLDLF